MANLYNPPSVNAVQKTLDAQLLAGATASVTLNNTTNIVDGLGAFVVDRVDANGESTASKREYITFTGVSGSTLTGLTRNADGGGTDQDHAVGAIVEFVSDVVQAKAVKDVIETEHTTAGVHGDVTLSGSADFTTEHNTDGTHKSALVTTLKATGAEINTGTEDGKIVTPKAIADSNIPTTKATSAEVDTGTEDAKYVTPKAIADSKVSYTDETETLTNKRLTSPKINEDVALTSTATELNALDGQTGSWTTYVPTLTNITLGNGSLTFRYCQIGKTVHVQGLFTFGSTSVVTGLMGFSLPVTGISGVFAGTMGTILDSGTAFMPCRVYLSSTTRLDIYALNASGTYLAETATSSSVPMTWAENDSLSFYITYQAL